MAQDLRFKFSSDDAELMRSFDRIQKRMRELDQNQSGLDRSTKSLTSSLGSFVKGYLAVETVIGAGRAFLDAANSANKFEAQLNAASDTQADFGKNMRFLEGLADKYKKNVLDLGQSFAQLSIATKGTNLEGEKTERLFAAVTAASATLKMSAEDTTGTFRAFIQMVSKGNVQAEELRGQLGERLYGAFNLAAKAMGVTTSELNKMLEQGEVAADDLLPRITVELERAFGDKAVANAHNLGSEIEYMTGQLTLLLAEAGKSSGLTDFLTDAVSDASELVRELRNANKEFGLLGAVEYTAEKGAVGYVNLLISGLEKVTDLLLSPTGLKSNLGRVSGPEGKLAPFNEYMKNQGMTPSMPGFPISGEIKGNQPYLGAGKSGGTTAPTGLTEKQKKAADKKAREAEKAINKWVREQIEASQQRIAEKIAEINSNRELSDITHHGTLGAMGQLDSKGLTSEYSIKDGYSPATLTNPATGDGTTNYDTLIANMTSTVDKVIAEQNRLKNATDDFGQQLDASIKASLEGALVDITALLGQVAGSIATGTFSLADAGNAFLGIMATLFDNIGKSLASYAATILLADLMIGSMNPVGALAGAALAFAAGAAARAAMQDNSADAFYSGGIAGNGMVQGRGGVDKVPAMLSPGEMVLNKSQQRNMWGMINGAYSGAGIFRSHNNGGGSNTTVTVVGRLRAGDIAVSGNTGNDKNRYFSGKRR